MPAHNHSANASSAGADATTPAGTVRAVPTDNTGALIPDFTATPNAVMAPQSIGVSGGNQPHANMQPYTAVSFIIAPEGIYPTRN